MSAPPPDVVEFERTKRGLLVWFSDAERLALGNLMISSGILNSGFWQDDLEKLDPVDRQHVEDALDRVRRARGEPHYADPQPGDDW